MSIIIKDSFDMRTLEDGRPCRCVGPRQGVACHGIVSVNSAGIAGHQ